MELEIFTPEALKPPKKIKTLKDILIRRTGLFMLSAHLSEKIQIGNLTLARDNKTKGPYKDWYLIERLDLFKTRAVNGRLAFNSKELANLFLDEFDIEGNSVKVLVGERLQLGDGYAWPLITAFFEKSKAAMP